MFAAEFYFLPYLIPVLVFASKFNLLFFKSLLKVSNSFLYLAIIIEVYWLIAGLNIDNYVLIIQSSTIFFLGLNLLFLNSHFLNRKTFILSLIAWVLLLFILAFLGRRGGTISVLFVLASGFYLRISARNSRLNKKISTIILLFLLITFSSLYIMQNSNSIGFFQRGISQDSWNESRQVVFEDFFSDFKTTKDWIFGRGIKGEVFRSNYGDQDKAGGIENGALTMLLKGGLFYLVPALLIMVVSAYLSFYKTNNHFTKSFSFIIVTYLINMISFGVPNYSSDYILLWICIASGYSNTLRAQTDKDISYFISKSLVKK